jgi:hypothetical protein
MGMLKFPNTAERHTSAPSDRDPVEAATRDVLAGPPLARPRQGVNPSGCSREMAATRSVRCVDSFVKHGTSSARMKR